MAEIIPAIMPQDYDDLLEKVNLFVEVVPFVQLDIMDGKFVPERTWPYPLERDPHFGMIVDQEEGMPRWEDIDFEIDLMVENPEFMVPKWVMAGARRVIVHVESMKDFETIRSAVPDGLIELGLAINTTTPLSVVEPYVDRVDFVQCMGIARIGFQGEAFDERVLDNVRALHALRPDLPISIDGSVNFDTARSLVEAGATRLVAGSVILESENIISTIDELKNLL
ncbi:hypothetical protein AUJ77_00440 [Candidatus Nomurabacteria bacterium CG1_02_43_90]|uniref:Ribulose-phosphate 3-epimerase n=2 Tax=Parcubacteria group TaxID=1794811 RepID=A0A2M7Q4P9_9BACT|nr:MAG: hypothetical protein AUJ77_00440 [Candidatus Nomurabacteria bacterium CG1_02_43_90]PIY58050.1 MAG: hypothetical protein COY98_04060 [Candidatus Yonathbacteria bacterium CG_4_10_14_0_8_um_filter_43_17]